MGDKGTTTRQHILAQCSKLFAEFGYKRVTMQLICNATGLSRGGLYRHYNSTEEVFRDLLNQLGSNQKESFEKEIAQGISAKLILNQVLERMEIEMQEVTTSLSIAIYEFSKECDSEYMRQLNCRAKESWTKLLEYGVMQGEFHCEEIQETVDMILYSYQGVRMWNQIMKVDNRVAKNITNGIKRLVGVGYGREYNISST